MPNLKIIKYIENIQNEISLYEGCEEITSILCELKHSCIIKFYKNIKEPHILKCLIKNGYKIDIDIIPHIMDNGIEMTKILVEEGILNIDMIINIFTPLKHATSNKDIQTVKYLLDKGANVNNYDIEYYTPLHIAVLNNDIEMIKLLLESGADIDATTIDGETPLHLNVLNDESYEIIELLLQQGADPLIKDEKRMTPLDHARRYLDNTLIELLEPYTINQKHS